MLLGVGALAGVPAAALVRTAGTSGPSRGWSLATTLERLGRALQGNSLGPNGPQGDGILTVVSIGMAFLAGALAATLALIVCWLAVEGPRFRQCVFALVALAWALPGPIVGIGLKETILALVTRVHFEPLGVALYHGPSPLPILWANLIRFLPCAVVALWPVVRLVPRDLRDSVRLEGARPVQELTYLYVPLLWRTWLAVTIVMAALALSEIGAVAMRVETPGWQSFAAELFRRMHYGPAEDVATLCLLMVLMIAGGGLLVRVLALIQKATQSVRRAAR
jgi:iron(III) transport system permease protein